MEQKISCATIQAEHQLACVLTAIDQVFSGIIVTDAKGTIIAYNLTASDYEGISQSEAIGQNVATLYRGSNASGSFESLFLICIKTKIPILNVVKDYATPSGLVLNTVQNYYPIFSGDKVVGSFCILNKTSKLEEVIQIVNSVTKESGYHIKKYDNTDFENIIGKSPMITQAIADAKKIAISNVDALIIGETGTGKELFVKSMHNNSRRREKPFVAVNCAAIPENLLEGILFGTTRGSFTGSIDSAGLFEVAKDGTLFLDELNSMNLSCQSKLLRAIDEKKIRKLGADKEISVHCTIIGALNCEPLDCIHEKTLKKDLFYRLSVGCISIPPLRERLGDIPILLNEFIKINNKRYHKQVEGVSSELFELFEHYYWEGNIREFINVLGGMYVLLDNAKILGVEHLSRYHYKHILSHIVHPAANSRISSNYKDAMAAYERQLLEVALTEYDGNKTLAAKKLGISPQNLQYKLKKNIK